MEAATAVAEGAVTKTMIEVEAVAMVGSPAMEVVVEEMDSAGSLILEEIHGVMVGEAIEGVVVDNITAEVEVTKRSHGVVVMEEEVEEDHLIRVIQGAADHSHLRITMGNNIGSLGNKITMQVVVMVDLAKIITLQEVTDPQVAYLIKQRSSSRYLSNQFLSHYSCIAWSKEEGSS